MRFCFHFCLPELRESNTEPPSTHLSKRLSFTRLSVPVSGPEGPHTGLCALGPGFLWLLTTCCRQIVLLVLVHYCTFSCFSQNIKCIKDQWNSATNKDSTTADRVDGWSEAREKFDPLCIMLLCVHTKDSTHKAQRGGINTMLVRVETGRHVRWNFFSQKALIWLWFEHMCILSDISLCHKGSFL